MPFLTEEALDAVERILTQDRPPEAPYTRLWAGRPRFLDRQEVDTVYRFLQDKGLRLDGNDLWIALPVLAYQFWPTGCP